MYTETLAFAFVAGHKILLANLKGITHEDSLRSAGGAANGINWIAGHVLNTRSRFAARIGAVGGPFLNEEESAWYTKGSRPIGSGDPCVMLDRVVAGLEESAEIIGARLAQMTEAELEAAVDRSMFPIAPDNPTLGASVEFLILHEMYHSGQIGLVRRALGKPSGIGV